MKVRTMLIVAVALGMLAVPAGGRADEVTVDASVSSGSRTLTVKNLLGSTVSSVSLGNGGSSGLMVNVTDVRYSRSGYQVTASLSDLYAHTGAAFDCGRKIPSSSLSLGFLNSPTSLTGIAAVAAPVWNLSGSVSGALATTLGVASGTPVTITNLAGQSAERSVNGVYSGLETALPMTLAAGAAGAFTGPASHSACAPSPGGSPTTRLVMSGGTQNHAAMFAWVQNAFASAADQNSNGTITGNELTGSGSVGSTEMAEATRAALGAAGVNLATLDTLVNAGTVQMSDIYNQLSASMAPISSLIGQSGTYVSLPKLSASIPAGTASGTYRGTLTITLTDL